MSALFEGMRERKGKKRVNIRVIKDMMNEKKREEKLVVENRDFFVVHAVRPTSYGNVNAR